MDDEIKRTMTPQPGQRWHDKVKRCDFCIEWVDQCNYGMDTVVFVRYADGLRDRLVDYHGGPYWAEVSPHRKFLGGPVVELTEQQLRGAFMRFVKAWAVRLGMPEKYSETGLESIVMAIVEDRPWTDGSRFLSVDLLSSILKLFAVYDRAQKGWRKR